MPVLVLLHGLAGDSTVWDGLDPGSCWDGPCVAPDLPGHGRADPLRRYTFGALAAGIAGALEPGRPAVVLGHSLGGVVALALASGWFGVDVLAVGALGVKVSWTPEELAKAGALAAKPAKVFGSREEARGWAGKLAGLPAGAVTERDGGWRAAVDPRAFGVGRPDVAGMIGAARCPVILAAGEDDPMSGIGQLRALVPDPVALAGGHNVHVEAPEAVRPLVRRLAEVWNPARHRG